MDIRFRAYDKVFNQMTYGIERAEFKHVVNKNGSAGYIMPSFRGYLENDRFIVLQSTELRDLAGFTIYEGDVVEMEIDGTGKKINCEVKFIDGTWRIVNEELQFAAHLATTVRVKGVAIIGDKYTHPELLGGSYGE